MRVLAVLMVVLAYSASALAQADEGSEPLTAEQIADIDEQIERLNITRAQVIAPEDNPNIDRRPEGVLSVPEVDSGLDLGE